MADTTKKDTISQVLRNFSKFTIDSAVGTTLKSITEGRSQVHKIVQECLKDVKGQQDVKLIMKETGEGRSSTKEQHNVLANIDEQSDVLKKIPDNGIKGSNLSSNSRKKIFFRSRL